MRVHNNVATFTKGAARLMGRASHSYSVSRSNPIKGSHCFLEQETLPSLLNTGLFLGA